MSKSRSPGVIFQIPGFLTGSERGSDRAGDCASGESVSTIRRDTQAELPSTWLPKLEEGTGKRRREDDRSFSARKRGQGQDLSHGVYDEDDFGPCADPNGELAWSWVCKNCTYLNVHDRLSCEACGQLNKRRERLREDEAMERSKRLERMMQEREAVLGAMKDLDDLGDSDGDDEVGDEKDNEVDTSAKDDGTSSTGPSSILEEVMAYAPPESSLLRFQPISGSSPITKVPPDLLLACLCLLDDAATYCLLRTVSKTFCRLGEHEALWRPIAERYCRPKGWKASASRQQPRCTPPATASAAKGDSSGAGGDGGRVTTTKTEGSSTSANQAQTPEKPESWDCKVCGLHQADVYGLYCEFCSAQREIITPQTSTSTQTPSSAGDEPPSLFRKLTSYKDVAKVWAPSYGPSPSAVTPSSAATVTPGGGKKRMCTTDRPLWSEEDKRRADVDAMARSQAGRIFMAGATEDTRYRVAGITGDWYMLVKATTLDRALASRWETLHAGWEWLVNAARTALRTRLCSNQEQINARNDACLPISESFQKVVNKLTKKDWVQLWDHMRTEFCLQAEALRRDILRQMRTLRVWEMTTLRAYRAFLEDVINLFSVYEAWVFELDGFFGRLNDQVCGERYRATTSTLPGCGVAEENTPYVGEASLLAFRDCVLMHHTIRDPLVHAIEGSDTAVGSMAQWFGGEEGSAGERIGGGKGGGVAVRAEAPMNEDMEELLADGEEGRAVGGGGAASRGRRSFRITDNLSDLIERLSKICNEMHVADDPVKMSRQGREVFRRTLLRPLKDACAELRLDGKMAPAPEEQGGLYWDTFGGARGSRKVNRGRGRKADSWVGGETATMGVLSM